MIEDSATKSVDSPLDDWAAQTMWNQASQWWAEHLRQDKNRRREIFPTVLSMLGEVQGQSVLDAGCGEGSFSRILASAGARVTGVDYARLLDIAIEEELKNPLQIAYAKSDLRKLEPDMLRGGFDQVVCNLVLHCVDELDPVLANLQRTLKPGGTMVVSDLHPTTFPLYSKGWTSCVPTSGNEYLYSLSPQCPPLVLFLHTPPELDDAFSRNGFMCVERRAPPAHSSEHLGPGLPRFIYFRLKKLITF